MICSFFGHRICPDNIKNELDDVIRALITEKGVTKFLVGNQGGFDSMVRAVLKAMQTEYDISYSVVLAYMPQKAASEADDYSDTVFPECLDGVHPKYAITKRNEWMVNVSDYVITYVRSEVGGAARFKKLAEKKNKVVINL